MVPNYQIITRELVLRLIETDEAANFAAIIRHSATLHHWIDWCKPDFSTQEAETFIAATRKNWITADSYGFGVYERESDNLIGMVALNELYHTFNMASLGYWIADTKQGQGYGKKALEALIEFCFAELKLTRLEAVCDPENIPSQRLIESCGATFEARAKNRYLFDGKPKEGLVFSLIPR